MLTTLRSYVLATSFPILLLLGFSASAQVTVLQEDFNAGVAGDPLPAGWSFTVATPAGPDGPSDGWFLEDNFTYFGGNVPTSPGGGLHAVSNDDACNCDKSEDYMLSPAFDLTGYTSAELSFLLNITNGGGLIPVYS